MQSMHKEQRVGVFVDVQNMYYSAKNIFNAKVNFNEILEVAVGKRKLVRAIAYVINTEIKEEEQLLTEIRDLLKEKK